jgi:hypothetical protein
VSVCCQSDGTTAWLMPLRPPMMNIDTKPIAISIGVGNVKEPRHMVAIQLKIFTPVGTPTAMVVVRKTAFATGPRPVANIWCAHTP